MAGTRAGAGAMTDPRPAPPGWYLDPSRARTRWWDGRQWRDEAPADAAPAPPPAPWGRDVPRDATGAAPLTPAPWWPARHVARGAHAAPEPSPLVAAALDRPWYTSIVATVVIAVVLTVAVPALRPSPSRPGGTTPSASPSGSSVSAAPSATGSTSAPAPSPTSSRPAGGSTTLAEAEGSGPGAVPVFSTGGDWRLTYVFDCGALGSPQEFVLADGATELVRATAYTGTDALVLRTPGEHSLTVDTACDWTVRAVGAPG